MLTDEYTLSLSREVAVCKGHIARLQKRLVRIETRAGLTPDELLKLVPCGKPPVSKDAAQWLEARNSLAAWQSSLREYEDLLARLKS